MSLILGFDTSAAHCAAALISDDGVLASCHEIMGRGQAERLFPLLQELLVTAKADWSMITRLGVGLGPGNFTGIRISVAAARGLALSLKVPAVGVSTFDAIWVDTPKARAAVAAPRDQVYVCNRGDTPVLCPLQEAGPNLVFPPDPQPLAINIARAAARAVDLSGAPAPLYVRAADAAPSKDLPPVILDDA